MKKKFSSLLATALAFTMLLSSCGSNGANNGTESNSAGNEVYNPATALDANTLYVGETAHNGMYHPFYDASNYDHGIVELIYEALVVVDENGKPIVNDRMVTEQTVSEDGKDYTFKLKENITFSDGTPLKAEDVVFTYQALSDPAVNAYRVDYATRLKGYSKYSDASVSNADAVFEGVTADDDYTVTFHFEENLRINLADCGLGIIAKAQHPEWERGKTDELIKTNASKPIGSGPYKLKEFVPGQYTSLEYNTEYWADDITDYKIPNIVCKFVETSTEVDEVITGTIDVLPVTIEKARVDRILNDEDGVGANNFVELQQYKRSAYGFIAFRQNGPTVSDKLVRQAIAYAIDREGYVESEYGDLAVTLDVPMSQASSIYDKVHDKLTKYTYDLEKSAALLDEAGWTLNSNGKREKDGVEMEIKFNATNNNPVVDALIPLMTESFDKLGIKLTTNMLEWTTMLESVQKVESTCDIFFMANTWSTDEPHNWAGEFGTESIPSSNTSIFSNEKFDQLLKDGSKVLDLNSQEAIDIYSEAALILNDELPRLPIYANTLTSMVNKRVHDLNISTFVSWYQALEGAYIQ